MKRVQLTTLLIFATFLGQGQTKNFIDQPYIEVSGYGDTLLIPNEIYIKIIISEKDTRDRVSVEQLEAKMIDGLKAMGIDTEKNLSTYDFGSNYRFYLLKKKDIMKTKQYILKVKDAVTTSKVFMMLEDHDISNVSIERTDHSEIEYYKTLSRIKAVENAKSKAITLTKSLNQTVGSAIYISDNDPIQNALQGRTSGVVITGYKSKADLFDKEPAKIEFEKIKVSTSVNIKFILK